MARMRLRDRILQAWRLRLRRTAGSRRPVHAGSPLRLEGLESRALLDGAGLSSAILFPNLAPQSAAFTTSPNVLKNSTLSMVVPALSANPAGVAFSLGTDAPAWATIGRTSGVLSLSPGADGANAAFNVLVSDNGRAPTSKRVAVSVFSAGVIGNDLVVYGTSNSDRLQVVANGAATITAGGVPMPILLPAGSVVSSFDTTAGGGRIYVDLGAGADALQTRGNGSISVRTGTVGGAAAGDVLDVAAWTGNLTVDAGGGAVDVTSIPTAVAASGATDSLLVGARMRSVSIFAANVRCGQSVQADAVSLQTANADLKSANFGNASLTLPQDGAAISLAGAGFGSLVVTGAGTLVDLANATFTTLENRSPGGVISVANATFQSFVNSAPQAIVDLASSTFVSILNTGDGATLNLAGAQFSSFINEGLQSTINIGAANFKALVTQTSTINLGGIKFDALINKGAGTTINLGGANFKALVKQTASINLGGIDFRSLENTADNVTVNVGGVDFSTLVDQGGAISVGAIKFDALVNKGGGTTINLGGANFKALTKQTADINLGGANFNALVSKSTGTTINLGGANFSALVSKNTGTSINLGGVSFGTLINEGNLATLNLGGVDFGTLVDQGGPISIGAIKFDALVNKGIGSKINLGGANFKALTKQTADINLGGVQVQGILNTADGVSILTAPANFSALVSKTAGTTINLGGVQVGTLLNSGKDVSIDLTDTTFTTLANADPTEVTQPGVDRSTLTDAGSRTRISLTRVTFDTLVNAGSGSTISVRDAKFAALLNSGNAASTAIGLSGSTFQTLANYGASATLDIGGANFKALTKQTATINLGGIKFDALINKGTGTTINLGGADLSGLVEQTAPITVGAVELRTLLNTADGVAINIGGANFKALTKQTATINLGGIKFDALINKGNGTKINLGGADFGVVQSTSVGATVILPSTGIGQILNEGTGVSIVTGAANFSALIKKNATINLGGIKFDALVNKGTGTKINLGGISFGSIQNLADATEITLTNDEFSDLVNRGGGASTRIDILGGKFLSLTNTGNGVGLVRVAGAAWGAVRNDGDSVARIDVAGGSEANVLINDGDGVNIIYAAGDGDDVFVNNASCDAVHGNAVTMSVNLGNGNDRAVIGGQQLAGRLTSGIGNEQVFFVGGVTGALVLDEAAGTGNETLDFSRLTGGGVTIDLGVTTAQVVRTGLTLTLTSIAAIENVVGTPSADVIRGNVLDNVLSGADAADVRGGAVTPLNGRTQIVLLDFDSRTEPGEHLYTASERGAILAGLNAIYAGFQVSFVTSAPAKGDYATVFFNQSRADGAPGGDSSEIDFGNRFLGGTAIVQVNGLLGLEGGPDASSANFVAASTWMAAHELGHLLGLRHADSFGPVGFGVNTAPQSQGLSATPSVSGAAAAWDTNGSIMVTPALTGFTLGDLTTSHFLSEREAVKLAFNARAPISPDGRLLVAEQSSQHAGISSAQTLSLVSLPVPNTLQRGFNAGKDLVVAAVDVVGTVATSGQKDVYRIDGRKGDLLNLQVMSKALNRYQASSFDAVLTVYDASGVVVASNDDEFESQDPSMIDLVLPADGSYFFEVRGYDATQTGSYELFAWRFDTASPTDAADVIDGREGNDLLVGCAGDDILFGGEGDDTISGDTGDDLVVGGNGGDRLNGGGDDDILVAGDTNAAAGIWGDPLKLWSFVTAWSTKSFRFAILRQGSTGDCSQDVLTGGLGADWFIVSSEDRITDRTSNQGDVVDTVK